MSGNASCGPPLIGRIICPPAILLALELSGNTQGIANEPFPLGTPIFRDQYGRSNHQFFRFGRADNAADKPRFADRRLRCWCTRCSSIELEIYIEPSSLLPFAITLPPPSSTYLASSMPADAKDTGKRRQVSRSTVNEEDLGLRRARGEVSTITSCVGHSLSTALQTDRYRVRSVVGKSPHRQWRCQED